MKKNNLIFSFAPSQFLWTKFCKQKFLELVVSLFEFQYMLTKIPFWSYPLNLETVNEKGEKRENIE